MNSLVHSAVRLSRNRTNFELSGIVCLRVFFSPITRKFFVYPGYFLEVQVHIQVLRLEFVIRNILSCIPKNDSKLWAWSRWAKANLEGALTLVHTTTSLWNPDLLFMLVGAFFKEMICSLSIESKWAQYLIDIQLILRHENSPLCITGSIVGWCLNEPLTCWCMSLLQRFPKALLRLISISLVNSHAYIVSFNKFYSYVLTNNNSWFVCQFSVQNSCFGA